MLSSKIVEVARTWLGVPFRHQGRNRLGVDCGGLLICVGEEAGINVIHPDVYSMSPDPKLIEVALLSNCDKVSDMLPGDVLWFSFAGEPRHVGLATDIGVIHSWAKSGKVVEHRLDSQWLSRLKGVYRPKAYLLEN